MTKIYIDAGHGGNDPGATANGLREKDLTLDIAKRIKEYLDDNYTGHTVKLSRTTDKTMSLKQRTDDANRWGADYFISIHINAGGGTGYEDFIYNGNVSANTVSNQHVMNAEIVKATGFHNRGKKRANFAVLRHTNMPAILTECGFIDNANDARLLKQSAFLDKVAEGHVNGLVNIFNFKKKEPSKSIQPEAPFADVPSDYWAAEAIRYVKENGLMLGSGDGTFKPNEVVTRAQLAQVLYNLSKK